MPDNTFKMLENMMRSGRPGRNIAKQVINKPIGKVLEILAHLIGLFPAYLGVGFKDYIGLALFITEKPPTSILKEFVDLDPGTCFFGWHFL